MKILFLAFFLFMGVGTVSADCTLQNDMLCENQIAHAGRQGKGQFDPVKFRKDLEAYITKEAGLTPDEAKRFFPVFYSSKKELRMLSKKVALASKRIKTEKLTEQECDQILAEIESNRKRCAEVQSEATKAWRKILPASKVLKVFNAEHNFGKRTFRTMVGKK